MPTQDEEFIKRLRATFAVEAEEHLQALSTMLLELEKSPPPAQRASVIESVYREAHSLKGAARAVDLSDIEAICQSLESIFSAWKRQQTSPTPHAFDALHQALDAIRALLAAPEGKQTSDPQLRDELIQRLSAFQRRSTPPGRQDETPAVSAQPAASAPPVPPPAAAHPPAAAVDVEKPAVPDTVRISIAKLDARLLEAEDMLVVKALTAQRATDLRDLTGLFDQWRKEWAKVSSEARVLWQAVENAGPGREGRNGAKAPSVATSSNLAHFLDWNLDYLRSLENRLVSLAALADHDRHSVAKRVDDLLEDSKKMLMLPFATLAGMFPKIVRDLCRDQGKEAELVIQGGDVDVDKRILEDMKDVLIHALRNCVDHGVEKPADRVRMNKPARATISVAAVPVNGSKVEIIVTDDGGGVDLERVKQSAVRHGVLAENEVGNLSELDALSLIFHSEVSTSPIVTAISGRGLGMAIVREKTERLGGRVSIESRPQAGTTLRIMLPLTLATFRGILVAVGHRVFVVPTANVERVLRVKPEEIRTVENREVISLQGRAVSLARLEAVLELAPKPDHAIDVTAPLAVVVLQLSNQRIAFAVDEVLHEEEVLVKPLRKPLIRVRNIAGATVLGSGKAVPILNVADLMKSARKYGAAPAPAAGGNSNLARKAMSKKVLIVEDSITSRMLLKSILEAAAYQVKTAVDGVDAFTTLRENQFDLVVSDVEMPRMNGFDLTARIRADKRLGELPVVLVTALESPEERERGIDAGASAYIVKSSFDQSNLLEVVRRLI